ncbi:MAG TPA: hypothetical protein DIU15_03100, partial [Deltaproteobacteria bacterium]|nr:hypothetical protein [Deltaproteobacteria bacterium]
FGRTIPGAFVVPREVLVDGRGVWTVTADDTLAFREVEIGWLDNVFAFIVGGLDAGSRVVLTPPSLPVQGARVIPVSVDSVAAPEPIPDSLLIPEPEPLEPDGDEPVVPATTED